METYNGFTNRETWAVCLWINNTEVAYKHFRALAKEQQKKGANVSSVLEKNIALLLEDLVHVNSPTDSWLGLSKDAVTDIGSLWRVDWQQVADSLTE
jgi:hypothetical protein